MGLFRREILIEDLINRQSPIITKGGVVVSTSRRRCKTETDVDTADLPDSIVDNPNYGKVDYDNLYFKVFFSQDMDNMGLFTDTDFIPDENAFPGEIDFIRRLPKKTIESYYDDNLDEITGESEDYSDVVRSYSISNPFKIGINFAEDQSSNFTGVLSFNNNIVEYVINANLDSNGNIIPNTGVRYETDITNGETTFYGTPEGRNEKVTSLSALVKEEKFFGIVFPAQIINDVFIERGNVTVMESHLRMSEITSIAQLEKYNNGFFNIVD